MVLLGIVKLFERDDLGYDRFGKPPRLSQFLFGFFREPPLLLVVVKDRTPVLGPPIDKLPSAVRGIDMSPKDIEQLLISHLRGVIKYLDGLDMPLRRICFVG